MKNLVFLLLVPLAFALPPVQDAMDENTDFSAELEGYFNSSIANNSSIMLSFGDNDRTLYLFASVGIAGMNLLLDNMTHPTPGLSVITARGYQQDHLVAIPSDGYPDFVCDRGWFESGAQYAWRCDFDGDNCVEYESNTWVFYNGAVNFTFRNVSESVEFTSNEIEVPEAVLEEMETSSGRENLSVIIEGRVEFIYEINNRTFGADCASNLSNHTGTVPFSVNASFPVAGDRKLFFLKSPVLREQWFRNNRFDAVVLSQSPLYYAEILFDGNQSRNFTIRDFYNTTGAYGLVEIHSNQTSETGFTEYMSQSSPFPLQREDYNYTFIYEFSHRYSGLGLHNLSLSVNDSFLGREQYNETLLSRMLSYGGAYDEKGERLSNSTPARKSAGFAKQELTVIELSLGFVGLVLFLAFLNFWMPE
ncbi:hypothetical protein GF318_03850 [Candidatus Micrarchaeota archaeon]|nr:hypothetical protein [Candidatus Micrarchaeota archaeon]